MDSNNNTPSVLTTQVVVFSETGFGLGWSRTDGNRHCFQDALAAPLSILYSDLFLRWFHKQT
jgi:hypothetical protein